MEANRQQLCKLLWKLWSPAWAFDDKPFSETAKSFDNPDFVATAIQSYRHRYANAPEGDNGAVSPAAPSGAHWHHCGLRPTSTNLTALVCRTADTSRHVPSSPASSRPITYSLTAKWEKDGSPEVTRHAHLLDIKQAFADWKLKRKDQEAS